MKSIEKKVLAEGPLYQGTTSVVPLSPPKMRASAPALFDQHGAPTEPARPPVAPHPGPSELARS